MAYEVYRPYFEAYIEFVEDIENADFVVLGFMENLNGLHEKISKARKVNPDLKVIVISEEPLWDTVSGGDFQSKSTQAEFGGSLIPFFNLNHVTSSIFDFEYIPYFLTTNDEMFARYGLLFSRNRLLSGTKFQQIWQMSKEKTVFLMQKRLESLYSVKYPDDDIYGLSQLRCKYAIKNQGDNVKILGPGWEDKGRRQELPDWHLDKISRFDRKVNIMSAIENTHLHTYITEKIFDAFAMCAIPIYYAAKQHRVFSVVEDKSFINLYGSNINASLPSFIHLNHNADFVERYVITQNILAKMFSNPFYLHLERLRVVNSIIAELEQL
ncbi:glycosyltransferase family 10 [Paraglaciecola chathamensis]|uniref:glycosyltransferase family 10 domain-containing protein n=1 Tax=Paraglaciecola chathamensis TaxID=368405 RepID=UPI0026FFF0ED|nr:glycosyltransferase family 10 [Paraglaciecola chathamensis]MDO6838031.1 glycosyltransferase family 10 [Paraglaciecola chathamensis]